jgi:hypothetical protein
MAMLVEIGEWQIVNDKWIKEGSFPAVYHLLLNIYLLLMSAPPVKLT